MKALEDFASLVRDPGMLQARELAQDWVAARPCDDGGYLELLGETPAVLAELRQIPPGNREIVVRHTLRTASGMAEFVASGSADGSLRLSDLAALKRYCYVVAGIVGELLTDLFLAHCQGLAKVESDLRSRAIAFGEGLQLVNILKDSSDDARDGRVYLPADPPRAQVLALARQDLRAAGEYVLTLQRTGAPRGMTEFTALPVLLARASLDLLERQGPGSKISRSTVAVLMGKLRCDVDAGTPVIATS